MKHPLFTTALLVSALAGGPMLAQDAPAREVQVEVEDQAQPAPVRIKAQRIVINAPDGVDGDEVPGQVIIVREIRVDEDGNAVVLDENGQVVEDGVWLGQVEQDPFAGPQPMPAQPTELVEATYLGVQAEPLDFESADLLLLPHGTGLNVLGVPAGGPAAAAGLEPGDVMLRFNDQVLINPAQLAVLIRTRDAGERVTLTVLRDGEELELAAELGTASVPALGPGGMPMQQGWQVQPMPIERKGRVELEPVPFEEFDLQDHMAEIEARIQQHQEQLLRMIAEIEGQELNIREQHEQLQQRLREQIREQAQPGQRFNAQRNMQFNDGEHQITLSGGDEGWQTLKVTDRAGQVIYDGEYPQTDEQWQQVPDAVRGKVRDMAENNPLEIRVRPIRPGERPAPAPPQDLPEPEQLPQA